jgi:hypothetical protein
MVTNFSVALQAISATNVSLTNLTGTTVLPVALTIVVGESR